MKLNPSIRKDTTREWSPTYRLYKFHKSQISTGDAQVRTYNNQENVIAKFS